MKKTAFGLPKSRDTNGFTILEVLMAMGIMSIGLLAVAAMQVSAVNNNKTGNTYTQAVSLARAQLETIKNGDIDDSTDPLNQSAFPGATVYTHPNNPLDENGAPGGIYTLSWTIDDYLDDTDGDGIGDTIRTAARAVTVQVSFPFAGSGTRQVSISALTSGGGL